MKKILLLALNIITVSLSQPIQQTAWVTQDGSIPIAVLPFKTETQTISTDKPWEVIANDFDFSDKIDCKRIEVIDSAKFIEHSTSLYVSGDYRSVGDSVYLDIKLNDINSGEMLLGKSYAITKRALRTVSHRFANYVIERIFLEKGPFETKILYTRYNDSGKNVYIMDYDGANSRAITQNGMNIMPTFVSNDQFMWVSFRRGKPDIYSGFFRRQNITPFNATRKIEASPDYSPVRGRVVYSSTRTGNSEIYTANLDGSNREKLTVSPYIDASPAWSPNGHHIAFISDRSGNPQLYVMDYSGANLRRLTYSGFHDAPTWSPDGKKIAFTAQVDGKFDIFTMDLDGSNETIISGVLPGSNRYPVWSPDGSQIIFVNSRGAINNIYRIPANGEGVAVPLTKTGDAEMPAWSFIEE